MADALPAMADANANSADPSYDPLESVREALEANMIINMRVYDVLMAMLHDSNAELAKSLLDKHIKGSLLGPMPYLSDEFLGTTGESA